MRNHLSLFVFLAASSSAAAQNATATVAPGARVRVESSVLGTGRMIRQVYLQRGDTLFLVPDPRIGGDPVALPMADVRSLEVSRGWRQHALVGAFTGLAVGVAAGAVYGNDQYDPGPRSCFIFCTQTRRELITQYASLGASVGPPLGALIGRFAFGDSWDRILPARARVSMAPGPLGGVRLGLNIATR